MPLYAFTILHTKYGLGRHIGCLSLSDVVKADKIQAIGEVPIMMSTLFSRISICLFLLRLFAVNLTWRWVLYFIIALTAATNIACATAILLQCHPRAKMWNPALPGTCWSKVAEVAIGQVQGGKPNELNNLSGSSQLQLILHFSRIGFPGPYPVRFAYILYVENSDELENQSRYMWAHVDGSVVRLEPFQKEIISS